MYRYSPESDDCEAQETPVQNQHFEVLAIDLFSLLPVTCDGDRWIFVVQDTATRWVELFPLKDATVEA
ncbi:hypothetical protein J437_LFUL018096 [Ladona fulva]|uniref:Uncharacterized protein n=1 Tax=Ladona fulva TaxID=123851 RepID=A0A8K0PAB4_LADFU|nr:hypothetical protein J437_LFUL018096 [Ladona fulva]